MQHFTTAELKVMLHVIMGHPMGKLNVRFHEAMTRLRFGTGKNAESLPENSPSVCDYSARWFKNNPVQASQLIQRHTSGCDAARKAYWEHRHDAVSSTDDRIKELETQVLELTVANKTLQAQLNGTRQELGACKRQNETLTAARKTDA